VFICADGGRRRPGSSCPAQQKPGERIALAERSTRSVTAASLCYVDLAEIGANITPVIRRWHISRRTHGSGPNCRKEMPPPNRIAYRPRGRGACWQIVDVLTSGA
jgi:hypothetical protein